MSLIIAVDGPSGSGKSSTSRQVAIRLGARYVDTGAMYRAMTWWMLREGIDPDDPSAVAARCGEPAIELRDDPRDPHVSVDGIDVSAEIRGAEVGAAVSRVSAVPEVRSRLVAIQRALVAGARERDEGVVVEGRDIGTVVLPDADLKIYMTATVEERARRRHEENLANGRESDLLKIQKDIERRDRIDSTRIYNPLKQAEDAVYLDTSHLDIKAVADTIYDMFTKIISGDIVKGENHNG